MSRLIIEGGHSLSGEVTVSGSKNAALPILAATLLTSEPCVINNVPDIQDIRTLSRILESLGAVTSFSNNRLTVDSSKVDGRDPDLVLVRKIRASVLILGPLLARFKKIKVTHPGGCHIGARPIDVHLKAFQNLGATVRSDNQFYYIEAPELVGAKIVLGEMSVTGTENIIMAAVLARGITEIRLAAAEPEVNNLAECLNKMGAKISGIGTHTLIIEGVERLHGAELTVIPDRLEAGTFAIAAAVVHGDVLIKGYTHDHLDIFTEKLRDANVKFDLIGTDQIRIHRTTLVKPVNIRTDIYPGFPTDLQAPFAILLTQAGGTSNIYETMYDGRLNYFVELEKMGATVSILDPHRAIVSGPTPLHGKEIESLDIRAGATLVLAALIADGKSVISRAELIDRGYERIVDKLKALGAKVERVEEAAEETTR
ncbi:UDP-N-acetylglucosamine 1-carboxyvinyltransferase [candidate division Kazan bacterium RIFCSPLOWO2_01_FULL_48_13]|uniref:UDP-N-acetylglucosamine 1-carboxyvinyltransferase n=1 Tax=candidate division Kazan bacterium RIFCSPLOWO2_01_FULL_48_13 TaxID=1798539 RepID=A0A1F4PPJ8_UNCK3|nr:MAG: UDP-N-acetylglucosamine 1-carboxyvinyltransferase [candidate division Kazan bacterium RIFCSPLOWO2_01_FULL_48_13]